MGFASEQSIPQAHRRSPGEPRRMRPVLRRCFADTARPVLRMTGLRILHNSRAARRSAPRTASSAKVATRARCVRCARSILLHPHLLRLDHLEPRREFVEQSEQFAELQRIAGDRDIAGGDAADEGALLQRDGVERGAGQRDADVGIVGEFSGKCGSAPSFPGSSHSSG